MTAKQTDDRTKTDNLQQMTATYKKNRKIILFCSTQEKRKIFQHKLAESTQRLTRASPSSLVFQTHTSTRLRSIVAEHQTFKHLQNLQTHTQKGDTESINRRTKKCPDITSGQFLRFWMFQQFCVFYVVMIFLKISLCFFSSANIIQIIDLNQIYLFFYAKNHVNVCGICFSLCAPNKVLSESSIGFNCLRSRFHCSTK